MNDNKSWWHTLPGFLTAIAAVLSALAALIGAMNNGGDDSYEEASYQDSSQTIGEWWDNERDAGR